MSQMFYVIIGILSTITIGAVISNYNNVRNLFKDIFQMYSSVKSWFRKRKLKEQVESDCKQSIDSLNAIAPELQMPDLSLEWVKKDDNGQVILEEGKAIVLLSYNRDNIRNLINTTTAYVKKALLPSSRYFLTEPVMEAIDFTVIKRFISTSSMKNMAMNTLFVENRGNIALYQDEFNKVSVVDDNGMLTRLLLREYSLWGDRQAGHTPNEDYYNESTSFLNFIYDILDREPDEMTPLQFVGRDIKVGVLLVAKPETYNEKGSAPYLRRIREGFSTGIRTFYLLARNEKIQILDLVYTELMSIGSFVLQNEAVEFKDAQDRLCICYCIEVNEKGNMAQDYKAINESIENAKTIDVTIERVRQDELRCMYNMLIPVVIPREEISDMDGLRLNHYYVEGMSITALPVGLLDRGRVKASVLSTDSNPKRLVDLNYAVGNVVTAIVEDPQDLLVFLRLKDSDQKAVAYRRNLTYSRNLFLHNLFPIGSELDFKIVGVDYIRNRLELQLNNLVDPWLKQRHYEGEKVHFTIYREDVHGYITELEEGISAMLPYSELTWIQKEIETEKKKYRRNNSLDGYVKRVDKQKRLIILTLKSKESPYNDVLRSLSDSANIAECLIESQNGFGLIGTIDDKYRVFIPQSEIHIDTQYFQYNIGERYRVFIKEVSEDGVSFIGSFRPFIVTPLRRFADLNNIGDELKVSRIVSITDNAVIYNIPLQNKEAIKARLFIGDLTSCCRIDDFRSVMQSLQPSVFIIKDIDFEHNNIKLSLKQLLSKNMSKRDSLKYKETYDAVVLGHKDTNYILVIKEVWIEGSMPIGKIYKPGTCLKVYLAANNSVLPEFYD